MAYRHRPLEVVITGASSGVGRATARLATRAGARVAVASDAAAVAHVRP